MPRLIADADLAGEAVPPATVLGPFSRFVFFIGSAGLIVAAAADALAVLGRHVGFRILGSIEIVQVAVVLIASAAVVGATLLRAHAAVHLLTSRLSPVTAARLGRVMDVLAALTFIAMAAGSLWIASDLWNGHERTELLKLPLRPFRLIWIAATLTAAAMFLAHAVRRTEA